jgi:class 3 adenylate cyclase
LALRVGVHSGFVISGGEEMLGRNVVLASRIAAFAGAGDLGVVESEGVHREGP